MPEYVSWSLAMTPLPVTTLNIYPATHTEESGKQQWNHTISFHFIISSIYTKRCRRLHCWAENCMLICQNIWSTSSSPSASHTLNINCHILKNDDPIHQFLSTYHQYSISNCHFISVQNQSMMTWIPFHYSFHFFTKNIFNYIFQCLEYHNRNLHGLSKYFYFIGFNFIEMYYYHVHVWHFHTSAGQFIDLQIYK